MTPYAHCFPSPQRLAVILLTLASACIHTTAPALQQYAWGKKGSDSVVAKLKGLGDSEYTVKPEETYAEMWIGTHPSGPSRVVRDGSPGPLLKVPRDRGWKGGGKGRQRERWQRNLDQPRHTAGVLLARGYSGCLV